MPNNNELRALLDELEDYFDQRADVIDGDYGVPEPNDEMRMQTTVRELRRLASASPAGGEVEYEVWQDDMLVAGASGPGAYAEALHYLAQYAQDGPVRLIAVTRIDVTPPALHTPQEPNNGTR